MTQGSVLAVIQADFSARLLDLTIAGNLPGLLRASLILAAVHIAIIVLGSARGLAQGTFTQRMLAIVRETGASRLFHAEVAAITKEHSGQILSRLTSDLGMVEDLLGQTLLQLLAGLLTAVLAVGYMLWRNWLLTAIAVLVTPLMLHMVSRAARPVAALSREAQEALARVNVVIRGEHPGGRDSQVLLSCRETPRAVRGPRPDLAGQERAAESAVCTPERSRLRHGFQPVSAGLRVRRLPGAPKGHDSRRGVQLCEPPELRLVPRAADAAADQPSRYGRRSRVKGPGTPGDAGGTDGRTSARIP